MFYPKVNIPEVNILVRGQGLETKLLLPAVSFPLLSALMELPEFHFPRMTVHPILKTAAEGGRLRGSCAFYPPAGEVKQECLGHVGRRHSGSTGGEGGREGSGAFNNPEESLSL